MKKNCAFILAVALLMSVCVNASAKVGDVAGYALHTDIVAYINHYAIPSYAANGKSCIVAEDLRNFGFDVIWDEVSRTLSIHRNTKRYAYEMSVIKNGVPGEIFSNILETDIKVYADGQQLNSYALNGYTMIPIEELTMFGEVYWVPEERAIKLWVDGINPRSVKQPVNHSDQSLTDTTSPTSTDSYEIIKLFKLAHEECIKAKNGFDEVFSTGVKGAKEAFYVSAYINAWSALKYFEEAYAISCKYPGISAFSEYLGSVINLLNAIPMTPENYDKIAYLNVTSLSYIINYNIVNFNMMIIS